MRERLHGNTTYFNVNRHINPTDVCVASCRLCAFGKRVRDPKAYTMSLDEVWHRAGEGWSEAVTEFHIVGGLHPELTLDWYCEMLRGLKQRFPSVHLKAFTMVEIAYFAKRAKISVRETLERLRDAGMDSLPGGGAEIFNERVRRIICDHKIDGNEWLETAREAHELGLQSNCTMLYGHIENDEDRADHLVAPARAPGRDARLRDLHPARVPSRQHRAPPHPEDDGLRRHQEHRRRPADARQHRAHQGILGDDDAAHRARSRCASAPTISTAPSSKSASTTTPAPPPSQGFRRSELLHLIRAAGRDPVERDTLYRPVERTESAFTVLV